MNPGSQQEHLRRRASLAPFIHITASLAVAFATSVSAQIPPHYSTVDDFAVEPSFRSAADPRSAVVVDATGVKFPAYATPPRAELMRAEERAQRAEDKLAAALGALGATTNEQVPAQATAAYPARQPLPPTEVLQSAPSFPPQPVLQAEQEQQEGERQEAAPRKPEQATAPQASGASGSRAARPREEAPPAAKGVPSARKNARPNRAAVDRAGAVDAVGEKEDKDENESETTLASSAHEKAPPNHAAVDRAGAVDVVGEQEGVEDANNLTEEEQMRTEAYEALFGHPDDEDNPGLAEEQEEESVKGRHGRAGAEDGAEEDGERRPRGQGRGRRPDHGTDERVNRPRDTGVRAEASLEKAAANRDSEDKDTDIQEVLEDDEKPRSRRVHRHKQEKHQQIPNMLMQFAELESHERSGEEAEAGASARAVARFAAEGGAGRASVRRSGHASSEISKNSGQGSGSSADGVASNEEIVGTSAMALNRTVPKTVAEKVKPAFEVLIAVGFALLAINMVVVDKLYGRQGNLGPEAKVAAPRSDAITAQSSEASPRCG